MIASVPLARLALVSALASVVPAAISQDTLPPRLSNLAAANGKLPTEGRKVTPIGQYGATRVMQLQLKAGSELSSHSAPERVLVIVLQGRGRFGFGEDTVPVHERQVLHMTAGEPHSVFADTDLDLLLVRIDDSHPLPTEASSPHTVP